MSQTMNADDETETEVVATGEYTFNTAALDATDLQFLLTETPEVYEHAVGDRVRVTYATAASGYTNEKTVEGRILKAVAGAYNATLKVATRDGVRVVREDYEREDTVVCTVTSNGNERVIGTLTFGTPAIELLRPEYERVPVETDEDEDEFDRGDLVTVEYESARSDEPQVVEGNVVYVNESKFEGGSTRVALTGEDEQNEWGLELHDDGEATLHKRLLVTSGHVGGRTKHRTNRVSTVRGVLSIETEADDLDRDAAPFYRGDRVTLADGTEGEVRGVRETTESGAVELGEDVPAGATVVSEGSSMKAWEREVTLVDVETDGDTHYGQAAEDVTLTTEQADADESGDEDDEDDDERDVSRGAGVVTDGGVEYGDGDAYEVDEGDEVELAYVSKRSGNRVTTRATVTENCGRDGVFKAQEDGKDRTLTFHPGGGGFSAGLWSDTCTRHARLAFTATVTRVEAAVVE